MGATRERARPTRLCLSLRRGPPDLHALLSTGVRQPRTSQTQTIQIFFHCPPSHPSSFVSFSHPLARQQIHASGHSGATISREMVLNGSSGSGTALANGAAGPSRTVLVTGGAGYIGSHAVLQLLAAGFRAVVVDSLENSSELAVSRVAALAGDHAKNLSFHKVITPPLAMLLLPSLPLGTLQHFSSPVDCGGIDLASRSTCPLRFF